MKKPLALTLFIILLAVAGFAVSESYDTASFATASWETTSGESGYFSDGIMKTLGKERIFTRSGPAAGYRDTGTYSVKDGYIRVFSYAYGKSDNRWIQCDFSYNNKLRRLYTRLEDIDADCFDFDSLLPEKPLQRKTKVKSISKLSYGPGDEYDTYSNSFKASKGETVYIIIAIEDDCAHVEWTTSKQSYRVWSPIHILGN